MCFHAYPSQSNPPENLFDNSALEPLGSDEFAAPLPYPTQTSTSDGGR